MKLSRDFHLHEFLRSQTAARHDIDMTPTDLIVANLTRLCVEVLQPARTVIGLPFLISSGYRPPELNRLIGGSETSAHMGGRAADFVVLNLSPYKAAKRMQELRLPYDQLILEFPPNGWIHVGIADGEPREQDLTATRIGGRTHYGHGIVRA